MKKVLVISSSPRKNGNSDLLAREFERGAREAGNEVEFISLREKKIGYCLACNYCHSHGNVCAVLASDSNAWNVHKVERGGRMDRLHRAYGHIFHESRTAA